MDGLHLVQENVLTSACNIFESGSPQKFSLALSTVLKECKLAYLESDAICSQPLKLVHEGRPPTRIQSPIYRAAT